MRSYLLTFSAVHNWGKKEKKYNCSLKPASELP